MTFHVPVWLLWTLGIVLGVPALAAAAILALVAWDWARGRNPFN